MELPAASAVSLPAPTGVRYLVLAWLCALATLSYIHRSCIAVPAEVIQGELSLSGDQMSWVLSAFFISYAIFQVPTGWLGDRLGTRRALPLFTVVWSVATAMMALPLGLASLLAGRFAMGLAQAGIFPCAVNSIARWFPLTQRAFPSGMLGSFMSVGAVIGTALTGLLLNWLDWQWVFVVFALPGLVAAVWFYTWFRDRPEDHPAVNVAEVELIHDGASATLQPVQEPTPWGAILSSPVMLLICTQQFFRAAGYNFYLTWFPTYLQKTRGVSVEDSGYLTSLPLAGTVLGSLTAGVVMDWVLRRTGSRTLSRKGMALTSALATSGFLVLAYFIAAPLPAVAVLSLSAFCAGLAGPAAYTVTIDLGGRHIATVFSTMNMGGNIGAVLLPVVVDLLVDRAGWEPVLFFLAGLYVAAATCWGLVNVNATVVPDTKK